jgi:hypothetical protein
LLIYFIIRHLPKTNYYKYNYYFHNNNNKVKKVKKISQKEKENQETRKQLNYDRYCSINNELSKHSINISNNSKTDVVPA